MEKIQIKEEYNSTDLIAITNIIEKMEKINQLKILQILKNNPDTIINENKNGIYVNLTTLQKKTINEIIEQTNFIIEQNKILNEDEQKKKQYKELIV
jgi:hypothetical protein